MKILAGMPSRLAANATAAPWLPPEAATTPAFGTSRVSRLAKAPRGLKLPACCSSSSLKAIGAPARPKSPAAAVTTGVSRTCGAITAWTLSISARLISVMPAAPLFSDPA